MSPLVLNSPAKINLLLAITGRRTDGFHSLVSVVTPLAWGDTLRVEPAEGGEVALACDDAAVPTGEDNLIVRAARLFRERTGWAGGVRFTLEKRIPMGAGGGGPGCTPAFGGAGGGARGAATRWRRCAG